MKRRQFIAGLGSAAAWPVVARAQQAGRVRRVGVLMPYIERDTDARLSYFVQGLAQLGWIGGRNLRMDVRWAAGKLEQLLMYANELAALQPDAILVDSIPGTSALQRLTKMTPIVFVTASDPIGSGFVVAGLPRPGGNLTGFIAWEPSMATKWLQFLTEIAPNVNRVAALFNPDTACMGLSLSSGITSFFLLLSILLFDPRRRAFFRPDRIFPSPSRAAAVKDGASSAPPKARP